MTHATEAREALRETTGLIFDIDQTATHDGPGLRMMVYLKGCPLRCLWCHSPESQAPEPEIVWFQTRCEQCGACVVVCPQGIRTFAPLLAEGVNREDCIRCEKCLAACEHGALEMKGEERTAGEIVDEAVRLKPFFRRSGGGMTLSGGEPTLQHDFAYALLALARDAGIHTAIETTGFTSWTRLERIATVTDLFLYDLKHANEEAHRDFTGVSLAPIVENLTRLVASGAEVIVRVPAIPGINDAPETIRAIGRLARRAGAERISLLPFNPSASGKYGWLQLPYPLEGVKRQTDAEMRRLEAILNDEGLTVVPA